MPRPSTKEEPLDLPENIEAAKLPCRASRQQLARIHSHFFGPISARTLENWPLVWHIVNGRAVGDVPAFLAEAQRRFDAAPVVVGSTRRGGADQTAA